MKDEFEEFVRDVQLTAQAGRLLKSEAFFQLYAEAAAESGDIEDAQYCPVLHDARPAFRIDGYYLNTEQGELGLVICDYRPGPELETVNASDCEALFVRVLRFFQNALNSDFINQLEDQSPAFQAAYLINSNLPSIRRVRVIIFTSGKLSVRKGMLTTRTEGGVRFTCSILDFQRYHGIQVSRRGVDPIEIDLKENGLAPLPCLPASSGISSYSSYLVVVPATVLGEIYGLYGARLLESNVRTYLQAKTKVNKGIQRTLKEEPANFFAYNNGLTATASEVKIELQNGVSHITRISDLQIVNGGQTTASILYARDKVKVPLDEVFVQMKLSVVSDDVSNAEIVPKISKYANSQNKISDADFFASHAFHLHLERMSRRIAAPVREGELVATKWFYERSRGQYRDQMALLSAAQKRKFEAEYPKSQMLVKTDLARYELSFMQQPHAASLGAQKGFVAFAAEIDRVWTPEALEFGDSWFKDAMARALIFRWTDSMIGLAEWYQSDRAYKAQTVNYTAAVLALLAKRSGRAIDYRKVWNKQSVPESMKRLVEKIAPIVARTVREAPESVRNIGEYCKRPACWQRVSGAFSVHSYDDLISDFTVDSSEIQERSRDDRTIRRIDIAIDAQTRVVGLNGNHWRRALSFAAERRLGTPTERGVLEVCAAIPSRIPTEKQSLVALKFLELLEREGFKN